jgi:monovalent cation:H+ antiporter-2, CPA2 family
MHHDAPLISLLAISLALAFLFGWGAARLRVSPIVGYIVAGVVVGPFTPGYVADPALAQQLAEVGVMLLMFGVGLHFSPRELFSVRAIAAPAALIQILVVSSLGALIGMAMGWRLSGAVVFGLSISIASTVVTLRIRQDRRQTQTETGRITVGWLVMEDLAMILALVLLPTWASIAASVGADGSISVLRLRDAGAAVGLTMGKIILFAALMFVVGRRVVPWLLHQVVHLGSRELFRLCVLAIALGVAWAASAIFGISLALGALFAGLVMAETDLSQQAANETLPLSDAFAVLFFVSVGMLFDPMILITAPLALAATVLIILLLRNALAYWLMRWLGQNRQRALLITASRSQIGEFSFIIIGLGVTLGLLVDEARDIVVGSAILTICVTPFIASWADRVIARETPVHGPTPEPAAPPHHVVLVGYGRVGSLIASSLSRSKIDYSVIEVKEDIAQDLAAAGVPAYFGNAASIDLLKEAGVDRAGLLLLTSPNGFENGRIVEAARELNPGIRVYARAHSDAEVEHLQKFGADLVVLGEREIAEAMISAGLRAVSTPPAEPAPAAATAQAIG